MPSKLLISINKYSDIKDYETLGVKAFLFPLHDFSIGYPHKFKLSTIKSANAYLLINRILDCSDVDKLKIVLKTISSNIKGIVFEDIAVFNIAKELKLDIELIWWGNHFGTNSELINFYLELGIDSAFLANEITKEEINSIVLNSLKPLVVQIFGYNQIMYSRRLLLSNYTEYYHLLPLKEEIIKESTNEFKVYEENYGTVIFNNKVYNGLELLNTSNIKYFYINSAFLSKELIVKLIKNDFKLSNIDISTDNGFLSKKTIYKLSEVSK